MNDIRNYIDTDSEVKFATDADLNCTIANDNVHVVTVIAY